jgi:hypothetical protein
MQEVGQVRLGYGVQSPWLKFALVQPQHDLPYYFQSPHSTPELPPKNTRSNVCFPCSVMKLPIPFQALSMDFTAVQKHTKKFVYKTMF